MRVNERKNKREWEQSYKSKLSVIKFFSGSMNLIIDAYMFNFQHLFKSVVVWAALVRDLCHSEYSKFINSSPSRLTILLFFLLSCRSRTEEAKDAAKEHCR